MWDAPEPQDRNFNRFARREITKATRAAEYWSSEFDEYALPGMAGAADAKKGFQSARMARPDRDRDRDRDMETSPKKIPPKPIKHRSIELPAPMPFTFGTDERKKPEAGLGAFTSSNSNFLANLDSLGVGDPSMVSSQNGGSFLSAAFGNAPARSANANGSAHGNTTRSGFNSPFGPPSPNLYHNPSATASAFSVANRANPGPSTGGAGGAGGQWGGLANLGPPDLADGDGYSGAAISSIGTAGAGVPLARGTKRLGMGRPAPWGSKR
jgi:hypothetical protein